MTSLASLAHQASPPAFNSAFYATAATVIPVLFLAIAVQGRSYENLLKASAGAIRRSQQRHQRPAGWRRAILYYIVSYGQSFYASRCYCSSPY